MRSQGVGCSSPLTPPGNQDLTSLHGHLAAGLHFGCRSSPIIGLASAALLPLGAGASCSPHFPGCRWPYQRPPTALSFVCPATSSTAILFAFQFRCIKLQGREKKAVKRSRCIPMHSNNAIFYQTVGGFNSPFLAIHSVFPPPPHWHCIGLAHYVCSPQQRDTLGWILQA